MRDDGDIRTGVNARLRWDPRVNEAGNVITVATSASVPAEKRGIIRVLLRVANVEAREIGVVVKGSTVVLSEPVRASFEGELVRRAVWSAPGVTGVEDRLHIQ
jgi:osmotically-inducible protein OsmY